MKTDPSRPVLTLPRLGLYLYAFATTTSMWFLVWLGGLVTSKEAGMTVPDWPTTFGYNMFMFPLSKWTGGIFYEHSHRLLATIVGLLAVGLMLLAFNIEKRVWVKRLSVIILLVVVVQGILGGYRVTLAANNLGLIHGCVAQACLALMAFFTLATSPWWEGLTGTAGTLVRVGWIKHVTIVTVLIFLQLTLGAAMRHAHAGLSIPDFPTAYGDWWPHVSHEKLAEINQNRAALNEVPTSLAQIHLQMTHRLMACLIFLAVLASTGMLLPKKNVNGWLKAWNVLWSALVVLQMILGAWTIWSQKAADIATAHVAVGALLLTIGVIQIRMAKRINQVLSNPTPAGGDCCGNKSCCS